MSIISQRFRRSWLVIAGVLALLHATGAHTTLRCGDIQLASTANASIKLLATIDKLILETGFDCSVKLVTATTDIDTLTTVIESAEPAFASATAATESGNPVATSADAVSLRIVNGNPITGLRQGWWITPEAVKKHPELKTVLDVLEHPELFTESEDSARGKFFGCPTDSECHPINANLFRAFEMEDKGWELVTPDSQADLEHAVARAIADGQNWFGYHESPSATMGRHDLVELEFGIEFAGVKNWNGCIVKPVTDCDEPMPTAWRALQRHTVITDRFYAAVPGEVLDYLTARAFPEQAMSSLLAMQSDKQMSATETAKVFLLQHTDIWKPWVSADVASKVTDSL